MADEMSQLTKVSGIFVGVFVVALFIAAMYEGIKAAAEYFAR